MKRRVLVALLAVMLLTVNAAAAFTDIEDIYIQQAANTLASLGIVSGDGLGQYEPDRILSRAEFTKFAVASLGVTNTDNYSSYTIFPDVPAGHWASGWVNAAVRHPDFAKNPIIRGLGDGRFGPSNPITLGEACTVTLRMLGYEQKDIGPNWPTDYVAKAKALGMLTNMKTTDPKASITRGDAAILFNNMMSMNDKEGKSMVEHFSGKEPKQNAILVGVSEITSTLNASQVTFYENMLDYSGQEETTRTYDSPLSENDTDTYTYTTTWKQLATYRLTGTIDPSLVGSIGTIVFDRDNPACVSGFIPIQYTLKHVTLERVEPEGFLADDGSGFIYISRDTNLVIGGKIGPYDEGWTELSEGTAVDLRYDEKGVLQVISTGVNHYNYPIVIMGINGNRWSIPSGYDLELDGKRLRSADDLKQYDVITLDSENKKALVSRNRITGYYDEASPSFRYPEWIKVLGHKFDIPENFSTSFKEMDPGGQITLLFDTYGRICGATIDPRAASSTRMEGVVIACTDSEITVQLFNGIKISGVIPSDVTPGDEGGEDYSVGLPVRVIPRADSQANDGKVALDVVRIRSALNQAANAGDWDIKHNTLGYRTVSQNVQVFEQVGGLVPMTPISKYDIDMDVVPKEKIISFQENSAGVVISITVKDVTGENWIYGKVIDTTIAVPGEAVEDPITGDVYWSSERYDHRVKMITLVNGKSEEKEFLLDHSLGTRLKRNQFIGLPRSALEYDGTRITLVSQPLTKLGRVNLEAFDGVNAVRTRDGYYPLADDVPVYSERLNKCMTLRQAKASFTVFDLYVDKDLADGGKVRFIVV